MLPITNDTIMTQVLIHDMGEIMEIVIKNLLKTMKGQIQQYVYAAYSSLSNSPDKYQRQGSAGFGESWISTSQTAGNIITSTLEQDLNIMSLNPPDFIHGSLHWDPNDIREYLVNILVENAWGSWFGENQPWMTARDFWNPFIQMLDNGEIEKEVEAQFVLRGIQFIKT
jgi:hypothetical protein